MWSLAFTAVVLLRLGAQGSLLQTQFPNYQKQSYSQQQFQLSPVPTPAEYVQAEADSVASTPSLSRPPPCASYCPVECYPECSAACCHPEPPPMPLYLKRKQKVAVACEGHKLKIRCPNKYDRIALYSTFYGRDENQTCQHKVLPSKGHCVAQEQRVNKKLFDLCQGENKCFVATTNAFLGKKNSVICPDVYKYAKVVYRCLQHPKIIPVCPLPCHKPYKCWPGCDIDCCTPPPPPPPPPPVLPPPSPPPPPPPPPPVLPPPSSPPPPPQPITCPGACPSTCFPTCSHACCNPPAPSPPNYYPMPLPAPVQGCPGSCPNSCAPMCSMRCCISKISISAMGFPGTRYYSIPRTTPANDFRNYYPATNRYYNQYQQDAEARQYMGYPGYGRTYGN